MDPVCLLSDQETLRLISSLCRKRLPELEGECFLYVMDALQKDDAKRLRDFKGQSKFTTFLHTTVSRLITDFMRHTFGRPRVPAAVAALGAWAARAWELLCVRNYSLAETFQALTIEELYAQNWRQFSRDAAPLADAPCPKKARFIAAELQEGGFVALDEAQASNPLEQLVLQLEDTQRAAAVRVLREVHEELDEADRLFVRLVFEDDLPVAKAGRAFGLTRAQAQSRKNGLLQLFRARLSASGLCTWEICPSKTKKRFAWAD